MVPLFTPPRIVSSKFFFLVLVVHREVLKKRGKRKPKSVFEFNQLIIVQKNIYILLTFYTKTSFDSIESLEYEQHKVTASCGLLSRLRKR